MTSKIGPHPIEKPVTNAKMQDTVGAPHGHNGQQGQAAVGLPTRPDCRLAAQTARRRCRTAAYVFALFDRSQLGPEHKERQALIRDKAKFLRLKP